MITNKNIQLPNPLSLGLLFYFLKGKMVTGRINLHIRPGPLCWVYLDQSTVVQVHTCRNMLQNTPQQFHPPIIARLSSAGALLRLRRTICVIPHNVLACSKQYRIICNCIHENACQYNIDNDWRCVNMVFSALSLVILMT